MYCLKLYQTSTLLPLIDDTMIYLRLSSKFRLMSRIQELKLIEIKLKII